MSSFSCGCSWTNNSEPIHSEEYANYLEQRRLDGIRKKEIIDEIYTINPNRSSWKWDNTVPGSCVFVSDNEEHVRVMSINYEHYLAVKSNVDMVVVYNGLTPTKERIEWIKDYLFEKVKEEEEKKNIVKNNIEEFEQKIEENYYVDSYSDSDSDDSSEKNAFNDIMTVIDNSNSGIYEEEAKKRAFVDKNSNTIYCNQETFSLLKELISFSKDSEILIKSGNMTLDDYMLYINNEIDIREEIFIFVKDYLETHDGNLGQDFVIELCKHLQSCGFSFAYAKTAVLQFIDDFNNRR